MNNIDRININENMIYLAQTQSNEDSQDLAKVSTSSCLNNITNQRNYCSGPTLFQNTENQMFMGKEIPKLFACTDAKSYFQQMCLTLPNLFGENWESYISPSDNFEYDPDNFNFSIQGPTGTEIYTFPDDGGAHNKIAVIDSFDTSNEETACMIDNEGNTVAHGEFVSSIIQSKLDEHGLNYEIDKIEIKLVDGVMENGVSALDHILDNLTDYRGVNMSIGVDYDYESVSIALGKTVTPENLADKKQELMKMVMSEEVEKLYNEFADVLDEGYLPDFSELIEQNIITQAEADQLSELICLRYAVDVFGEFAAKADEIAKQGIPVCISSGNDPNTFNFLSLLTTNVEYVGAENPTFVDPYDEEFYGGFSDNSLVTRYGKESYYGHNIIDGKIDIDDNGTGDLSPNGIDVSTFYGVGTSFSCPEVLAELIIEGDAKTITSNYSAQNQSQSHTNTSSIQNNNFNAQALAAQNAGSQTSRINYLTNQNITESLQNSINYNTTAYSAKEMSYQELQQYYAGIMGQQTCSAGANYYQSGRGSIFRAPKPTTSPLTDGMSYKELQAYYKNNPV